MRGVVFEEPGAVLVTDLPEPAIEDPGDVIVQVSLSAVCGSDLHLYHGRLPIGPGEPLGHEAVGIVTEAGPAVTSVRPGQRVTVAFAAASGACWHCRRGDTSLCGTLLDLGFCPR